MRGNGLQLHRTTESDLPAIYAWYTEPETAERALCVVDREYGDFARNYGELIESNNARCWIIYQGDDRIGVVEIRCIGNYSGCYQGEAVLWLGQQRDKGIGIYIIGWLLKYAFEVLDLDRLWWWVAYSNLAMIRICTKLGFAVLRGEETSVQDRVFFHIGRLDYERFAQSRRGLLDRLVCMEGR